MGGSIISARSNPYKNPPNTDSSQIYEASVTWNYNACTSTFEKNDYTLIRDTTTESFVYNPATLEYEGRSSFDQLFPWKDIRVCNVEPDGTVSAYEGEPGFTRTPISGDVMIEIPKFYYGIKVNSLLSQVTFTVSSVIKEGFYISPRHEKFGDMENDLDYIYIAAYPSTTGCRSLSGAEVLNKSTCYQTQVTRGNVAGFYQMDYLALITIEILRIIETGNLTITNMHNMAVDFNAITVTTGLTDQIPFHSGYLDGSSWKYRGIENLADTGYRHAMNGIFFNHHMARIHKDPGKLLNTDYTTADYTFNVYSDGYGNASGSVGGYQAADFRCDESKEFQDWTAMFAKGHIGGTGKPYWPIYTPSHSSSYYNDWVALYGTNTSLLSYNVLYVKANSDKIPNDSTEHSTIFTRLMYLPLKK